MNEASAPDAKTSFAANAASFLMALAMGYFMVQAAENFFGSISESHPRSYATILVCWGLTTVIVSFMVLKDFFQPLFYSMAVRHPKKGSAP